MDAVARSIEAIDKANRDDPTSHDGEPLALAEGRTAETWVVRFDPTASVALRLAARAHHLRRWAVPRTTYPDGRAGYLRWRRDQLGRHATELTELLESAGIDADTVHRAAALVAKKGLGSDPDTQVLEDAVSLTFLETQLARTARRLCDDDRMVEIIAKTLAKMSPAGREATGAIELDPHCADLVARAVERHASG